MHFKRYNIKLNNNLNAQPQFLYDADGRITGYKTPGGADTVFPFSQIKKNRLIYTYKGVADQHIPTFGNNIEFFSPDYVYYYLKPDADYMTNYVGDTKVKPTPISYWDSQANGNILKSVRDDFITVNYKASFIANCKDFNFYCLKYGSSGGIGVYYRYV